MSSAVAADREYLRDNLFKLQYNFLEVLDDINS